MQIWLNIVHVIQLLSAITMIGLVLLQHGKGADMGASFGSGASGSLFGATGSANFLSRSTAVAATLFFICTLALAYLSHVQPVDTSSGSVLERAAVPASAPAPVASAPTTSQIPGVVAPAPASSTPAPATAASAAK